MSRDPIGERGGGNLFTFNINDAINRKDLFGLFSHQHGFSNEQLGKLRRIETESKRRVDLWINFLDPGPDDLVIAEYLQNRYNRLIPVQNVRLVSNFTRIVRNKTTAIKRGFDQNSYGVEYECECRGIYKNLIAYTVRNWVALGIDDDIHFCPSFFDQPFENQVGFFVHEMSHFFGGTIDDYSWIQPSANIGRSAGLAQLYEEMGRLGRTDALVKIVYYSWINAAITDVTQW